jgi:hypothetical protein
MSFILFCLWVFLIPLLWSDGTFDVVGLEVQDQKVSFHATPFEERLAQALATQETVSPRCALMGS